MGRIRPICLAGMGVVAVATAQDITASNTTVLSNDDITLVTSMDNDMVPLAPVLPLTAAAAQNLPPTGLIGSIFVVNSTSAFDVTSRDIAAINCDLNPGELQSGYMLEQAVSANASAVLLYSVTSDTCSFRQYDGIYDWIYAMRNRSDTHRLLEAVDISYDSQQELWAQIASSDTVAESEKNGTFGGRDRGSHAGDDNDDNDRDRDDDDEKSPLGPSPTTAVAMIILYSITGIITALFLVIIVTGALRAHRHPERYGPRNVIGRPRQSRAKGIARAMLDTLPIVKTGRRDGDPKPTDVELAENGGENRAASADGQAPETREVSESSPPQDGVNLQSANEPTPRRQSTAEDGIAAAVTSARRDSNTPKEHLGCSICTEDFEEGQDQRVLPCDHRFHPDCVDPWLLNVSGTCPLCRIDLHPPAEEPELDENGNPVQRQTDENGMPLPLNTEAAGERQRMSVRRSLLIGLIGSRSVERMSREERLAALRQLRARQRSERQGNNGTNGDAASSREAQGEQAEQPQQEDASGVRSRLRRVFGVRTRRTEARQQGQEQR